MLNLTDEMIKKLKEDFQKRYKEGSRIYDDWLKENSDATEEQKDKKRKEISKDFDIDFR